MDKFVVRTERVPRREHKSTAKEDNKKQATIESLAVSLHVHVERGLCDIARLYSLWI